MHSPWRFDSHTSPRKIRSTRRPVLLTAAASSASQHLNLGSQLCTSRVIDVEETLHFFYTLHYPTRLSSSFRILLRLAPLFTRAPQPLLLLIRPNPRLTLPPRRPAIARHKLRHLDVCPLGRSANLPIRLAERISLAHGQLSTVLVTGGVADIWFAGCVCGLKTGGCGGGEEELLLSGGRREGVVDGDHVQPPPSRRGECVWELVVLLQRDANVLSFGVQIRVFVVPHVPRLGRKDAVVAAEFAVLAWEPCSAALPENDVAGDYVLAFWCIVSLCCCSSGNPDRVLLYGTRQMRTSTLLGS